ncbi:hypothetical protein ACQ4PT_007555 [Festuca glaucescens]
MIPLPVFILLSLVCFCKSDDRLTLVKPLSTGDKLVSSGGVFALGFFSPTNSTANSYIGIWYNNIPERTYVWVANRDIQITSGSAGKLVLTNNSDLTLSDSKGSTLWTTMNNITSGTTGTAVILLDSGNLVVRLPNGTDIWQSFHYPTDTILPNMTLPLSTNDPLYTRLIAWRGPDDPTTSDYSMGGGSSSDLQVIIWNGSRPYWRRSAWDGSLVSALYQSSTSFIISQTIVNRGALFYVTFTVSDGSPSMRIVLHYTGMFKFLTWNSSSSSWEVFIEQPRLSWKFHDGSGENLYLRLASSSGKRRIKEIQNRHTRQHSKNSKSDELDNENIELPSIFFKDIVTATDNFSDYNVLGKGCFGNVYKGLFGGGKEVAIKRLSKGSGQGADEFRNEVVLIAKLQHRNLVRLLGYCTHEVEKLLVYEYLPNKSLDAFLFDATRNCVLDWLTRFRVIKGIARGLLYLHQDSRLTIIHRDLKASNVLLDAEMNPKISDLVWQGSSEEMSNRQTLSALLGHSNGYMSPEYAMGGSFSVKSDTYSFGVLLLEVVSGLKISSSHLTMDFPSLIAYAWSLWKDGNARELVNSSIMENSPLHEVLRCIHIGLLCVQDDPNARPLISSTVFMLENETAPLPTPREPVYFRQRKNETEDQCDDMQISLNGMTMTMQEGR